MSTFQVFSDDQENGRIKTRAKRADTQAAQKRTVLGQVTNIRHQPARAAKNAQFKVFEDSENVQPGGFREEGKKVKTTRTEPAPAPVFKPQSIREEIFAESPMVLDVSCMDTEDPQFSSPSLTNSRCDPESTIYCLSEYQQEIHDYLREAELRFRPKMNYMRKQADISPQMRTILVDWLVEVGEEYKLHDETLHLAVNYIDRFLSQMSVLRGKLQLVGTACMYIASKYEEIYPPDVGEFVYITDDTYTKRQLLRMEHLVVKVLSFDVAVPTANVFADLYCTQLEAGEVVKYLTQYIMELSLLDSDGYLAYKPSVIASSALFLATHIVPFTDDGVAIQVEEIESVTRYKQSEISSCVQKMLETLKAVHEQPQQAVRDKYKADSKRGVALLSIPDLC